MVMRQTIIVNSTDPSHVTLKYNDFLGLLKVNKLPDLSKDLPFGPALVMDPADGPHAADEPVGIGAVQSIVI